MSRLRTLNQLIASAKRLEEDMKQLQDVAEYRRDEDIQMILMSARRHLRVTITNLKNVSEMRTHDTQSP